MGTVRDETQELLKRIKAVGWTVRTTKSGMRHIVKTHTGATFTFGSQSRHSGDGSIHFSVRTAERYGLVKLEKQLAAQRDRDLAARSARAQAQIDAATEAAAAETSTVGKSEAKTKSESGETMKKTVAQVDGALGHVDGVAIMEVAPAKIITPITNGRQVVLGDAEELLLADGRVVYRCTKPAATPRKPDVKGVCHKTFNSAQSLRSHMTFHSRKDDTSRFLRDAKAKKQMKAAASKSSRTQARKVQTVRKSAGTTSDKDITRKLTAIGEQLIIVAGNLSQIGEDIIQLAGDVRDRPTADPDVVAKAAKFDQMQSLLHPNG